MSHTLRGREALEITPDGGSCLLNQNNEEADIVPRAISSAMYLLACCMEDAVSPEKGSVKREDPVKMQGLQLHRSKWQSHLLLVYLFSFPSIAPVYNL